MIRDYADTLQALRKTSNLVRCNFYDSIIYLLESKIELTVDLLIILFYLLGN